jgi:protein ImuB
MHAAIHIPQFPIQAVLSASDLKRDAPIALLDAAAAGKDKDVVLHINAEASRAGAHFGMTATQVQARCPQISFIHRDNEAEKAAQKKLLECAELWSPDFESTRPGLCVLDLTHVKPVLGQEVSCGSFIHQHLARHRFDARIGFASNPDLAILAAQAADPVLILRSDDDAERFLHSLPIAAMRPSKELHRVLTLWGVRTLGAFVELQRQDVSARLGHEGLLLWDMASGGHARMLKLVRPAISYREEMELEHAVESLEPLLFILRRMLQGLVGSLSEAWLVAASVLITLRFADDASHQHELRVAEPTGDVELLFRLLHTHLESFTAAAPIIQVALELKPVRALGNQGQLFERALRDPNRFAETLAQLEALVGAERVGRARLLPSRKTDSFAVTGYFEKAPSGRATSVPDTTHGLPLRRFRPSRKADVLIVDEMPSAFYSGNENHALIASEGPWLLSGDWWDAATAWQKEVWLVETAEGCLYQIAKEQGAWTVEGVVG